MSTLPGVRRPASALIRMRPLREVRYGLRASATAVLAILLWAAAARAQNATFLPNDFFQLESPGHAEATPYTGGYVSDKYADVQEGFQLEQSVTRYLGVFGRATGYQMWIGGGFASPLNPNDGPWSRINFGRLQAGVDIAPLRGTHLFISGGHDVGDSDAYVVEGDFNSWMLLHSLHPVNISFSAIYGTQNKVVSSEIDVQTILLSRETYMILVGAGGAIYGNGFVSGVDGQGGPDLGFYYRPWGMGATAQAGYGAAHQYGQLTFFKQFSWTE
jgi:hypothetical protein